jgi:hypothetical protein
VIAALIAAAGLSLQLPAGWHGLRLPGIAPVTDPIIPFVISSAPIRRTGKPCQIGQFGPSRSAVTIVVVQWRLRYAGTRWGPRPARFDSKVLPLRVGATECYGGRGGSVTFGQRGRQLGVYLMAGLRAPDAKVNRARFLLRTLRVTRR